MPEQTSNAEASSARRRGEIWHHVTYGILVVGTVLVCLSIYLSFHRNLDFAWTSIRLAPAFALTHGYPLYSSPETPPWVMVGYGPLYPVAYLPSTVAAAPGSAVAIATLLAHFYILVPVALLCAAFTQQLRQAVSPTLHWSFLLLLFALVAYTAPSLTYITSHVHVDAPAFGLLLFACHALLRTDSERGTGARWLVVVGVCAGLSAACKLNLAAAAVGFSVWGTARLGARAGFKIVLTAALTFCAVYACSVARDGFAAVLLNLQLPGKMPWLKFDELGSLTPSGVSHGFSDKVGTMLGLLSNYLQDYGIVALALLLLLPILDERSAPAARRVRFFLILAGVMLLASVASVGKSGGDVNSRALVTLPLTLAALFALAALVQQATRLGRASAHAAILGLIFIVALNAAGGALRLSIKESATMVEAYEVISKDRGRWYFPFDPLAHLLAEGKFRPNLDVVHSYAAAGVPVDKEVFRSALPEQLQHIAVPPSFASWGIAEIRRLMPEFHRAARDLDTEHHHVISR